MPSIIALPTRQGSIEFTDDQVADVVAVLETVAPGQGVALDDSFETENKARSRAKVMRTLLERDHDLYTRTHALELEDGSWAPVVSVNVSKTKAAA